MADQSDKNTGLDNKSQMQSNIELQRRDSSATTRTTLPSYDDSLALGTPPAYQSGQPNKKPAPQQPTAGASAATIRAIMGDPVPEEPRRSLRDRLLCRRPTYNRRRPSSERSRESSATWNVWGSPVSDPNK
ncbi:unnamed protein product [Aureobasidium mustum]|uniref:Uncharacterized protein n=1 Tax=Aureobasidium mustum TaxID=2773714 RepID=A0A9N8PMU4_9PEZI|nr:unnamed protein product [Aureobasidium mustum]